MPDQEYKERWQCQRCGEIIPGTRPTKCAECDGTMFRDVTRDRADDVNPDAVKHLKKKMTECIEYAEDKGRRTYHKLKLKTEFTRRIEAGRNIVQIVERCATCGHEYHQKWIPENRTDLLEANHVPKLESLAWS